MRARAAVVVATALGAVLLAGPAARAENRFGRWSVKPVVGMIATYNDNVFLTRAGKREDFITQVNPALQLTREMRRGMLDLNFGVEDVRYGKEKQLDTTTYTAGGSVEYELTSHLSVTLATSVRYTPNTIVRDNDATSFLSQVGGGGIDDGAIDDEDLLNSLRTSQAEANRLRHLLRAAATYTFSDDLSLEVSFERNRTYFDNVLFSENTSLDLGGELTYRPSPKDRLTLSTKSSGGEREIGVSSETRAVRASWQREHSPRFETDLQLKIDRTREKGRRGVPDEFVGTILSRDSRAVSTDSYILELVGTWTTRNDIRLRGGAGVSVQKDEGSVGQEPASNTGPTFVLGIDGPILFRKAEVQLEFERSLQTGFRGGTTTQKISGQVTYHFDEQTEAILSLFRVQRDSSFGDDIQTVNAGFSASFSKALTEGVGLLLSWSYLDQSSSSIVGNTSIRNLFTLTFTAEL